jgi:hypothetical protein
MGMLWLATGVILITSAILFFYAIASYWKVGLTGVILSQILIIIYWRESRYRSVVNIVIMASVLLYAAKSSYDRQLHIEQGQLISDAHPYKAIVTAEKLQGLPIPVQRWLTLSRVSSMNNVNLIHIHQQGKLRTTPHGQWTNFKAEQYFSIDPPAFIWSMHMKPYAFVNITGRDKFRDGHGQMLIKIESCFTIGNSSGEEINQGSLMRYLAETIWFPQAALSRYITWESMDDNQALATIHYEGLKASGVFTFNKEGLPISFEGERYGDFNGVFRKEKWHIQTTAFKSFNNIVVPQKSEVTWKLKEGDFNWLLLEVTDVSYNDDVLAVFNQSAKP